MELGDFHADLMNRVHTRASVEQTFTSHAFMAEMAESLADAEEVEKLEILSFEGVGRRQRNLAVHGFDLDDNDNSVALAVLLFGGDEAPQTFTHTDAAKTLRALQAFLEEAVEGTFNVDREESTPEVQLAMDLKNRGRNVSRYRLYLVSDMVISGSAKALVSSEVNGVPVDFHVWDLKRLHQVSQSLQGREELVIDLTEWISGGLPALELRATSTDFRTYLAAVPAHMVADLYGRYGSRLLEGNVRSYLSNRGKVNKGIRTTVLSEPAQFLAYNNGITATAVGVDLKDDRIAKITDLQIVNGGQTTASLFYVKRENKAADMTDVYVQMKLVVVEPGLASEMIPRISRYANSQNKVSEADFFSNSPFHIRLAEVSQRALVPAQPGVNYQTRWFYERTRGQYQSEKAKRTAAEQKKFEAEYPKTQVITKTDAAKYEVAWALQPHIVSRGAQKNFVAFAELVAKKWEISDTQFNELYWRHLVAKGILFESVRGAIAKADWYDKGYLANVTSYSIAKLAHCVGTQTKTGQFDFDRMWTDQRATEATLRDCLAIGEQVLKVLTSEARPVQNVTEWAKRDECWNIVRTMEFSLSAGLLAELADRSVAQDRRRDAVATQKIDNGIAAQAQVVSMQASEWLAVEQFGKSARIVTDKDLGILALVTGRKAGFPTEAQCAHLLKLIARCRERGFEADY